MKNISRSSEATYDFTGFTETKLNDDEPESKQIDKMLRKLIFSKMKSAQVFYDVNEVGNRYGLKNLKY